MNPKVGWSLAGAVILLIAALAVGAWWHFRSEAVWEASEAKAVHEMKLLLEENKVLAVSERRASSEATAANARANSAQKGKEALAVRLAAARAAIAARPTIKTLEQCQVALRDADFQNSLLEQALDLANTEATERHEAYNRLGMALGDEKAGHANTRAALAIESGRVKGYKTQLKRNKRKAIVIDIALSSAALAVGIGIGKVI